MKKDFFDLVQKYLDAKKTCTLNKERFVIIQDMFNIACKLFPRTNISLEDDPLELGRIILCIEGYDLDVSGEENIKLFTDLISDAENFEIYSDEEEVVKLEIMYPDVFDVTIL